MKKTPNKILFWSNDKTAKWSKKSGWDVKKTPKAVKAWAVSRKGIIYRAIPHQMKQPYPFSIYETREDALRMTDPTTKVIRILITPIKKTDEREVNNLCVKKSFEILKAERAVIKAAVAYRLEYKKPYLAFKTNKYIKIVRDFEKAVDRLNKLKEFK